MQPFADLELLKQADDAGGDALHRLDAAWQGSFLCGGAELLVRKVGTLPWFLPCGQMADSVCCCLPIMEVPVPGTVAEYCFELWPDATPAFHAVFDLTEWEAMTVEWSAPIAQVLKWPHMRVPGSVHLAMHLRAVKTAAIPRQVMAVAADVAFWDLPCSLLQKLCRHRGVPEVAARDA